MAVQYEANQPVYGFQGLYLDSNPEVIPDNSLARCMNFVLGTNGELIKRPIRADNYSSGLNNPYILGQMIGDGYNQVLLGSRQTQKTMFSDYGFGGFTEISALNGMMSYDAVQFLSKMYICATDGVHEWVTSGLSANLISGSPANAQSIILFQGRLFAIKDSRLYYTEAGAPTNWGSPANYVAVADGDGDTITAIVAIGDRILIFKQGSIWVLYTADTPANWTVRGVSPEHGCVGPKAVLNIRGIVYFLDVDGLWITDGVALSRISDPITPVFQGNGRTQAWAYYDTLTYYKDYLVLKINCTSKWDPLGYATFFYRFGGQIKGFTEATNLLVGQGGYTTTNDWGGIWPIRPPTSNMSPYYIATGPLQVYKLVDRQADQASIQPETVRCFFRTKAYNLGNPTRYKRIKYGHLTLFAEPLQNSGFVTPSSYDGLQYYWVSDGFQSEVEQIWQEGLAGTHNFKLRGAGLGRTHSFYFEENSKAANLQVLGYNFVYQLARQQDRTSV